MLPDLAVLLPEKLRPVAKAVVGTVLFVVTIIASGAWQEADTLGRVLLIVGPIAGALGIYGTSNVDPDDSAAEDIALELDE